MKAVRIHAYGMADVVYEDADKPAPGEQDVLIRVHATSVNPTDNAYRAGYMANYFPLALPIALGCDVAGVVEALGSAVRQFKAGDAVYARTDLFRLAGGRNTRWSAPVRWLPSRRVWISSRPPPCHTPR